MKSIEIRTDCTSVDWVAVAALLELVGMAHYSPEVHERAFTASHTTVFLYDQDRLVGFGRAISDGAYQAVVYDCAVLPDYQGRKLGSLLMRHILSGVSGCNILLYAAPGKEGFYEKHGFRKMKTGMALFSNAEFMREKGFTE